MLKLASSSMTFRRRVLLGASDQFVANYLLPDTSEGGLHFIYPLTLTVGTAHIPTARGRGGQCVPTGTVEESWPRRSR